MRGESSLLAIASYLERPFSGDCSIRAFLHSAAFSEGMYTHLYIY